MTVLNNIYAIRTQQRLSLRELAKKAGIAYATINNIENFRSYPCQRTMLRISRALNTPTVNVFNLDWEQLDCSL